MKFRSKVMITLIVIAILLLSFTLVSTGAVAKVDDKDDKDNGKLGKIVIKYYVKPD